MPKKTTSKTKQPAADAQLKGEVSDAVDDAAAKTKTGNVATAKSPEIHLRDRRDDSGVIGG